MRMSVWCVREGATRAHPYRKRRRAHARACAIVGCGVAHMLAAIDHMCTHVRVPTAHPHPVCVNAPRAAVHIACAPIQAPRSYRWRNRNRRVDHNAVKVRSHVVGVAVVRMSSVALLGMALMMPVWFVGCAVFHCYISRVRNHTARATPTIRVYTRSALHSACDVCNNMFTHTHTHTQACRRCAHRHHIPAYP